MHKKLKFFSLIFIISMYSYYCTSQDNIEINLLKKIDSQQIKSNSNTKDLQDLMIVLKGVHNDDDGTNYSFSGHNFDDPDGLIELTKNYISADKEITFNLSELSKVEDPPEKNIFEFKITYSGTNKPLVFGTSSSIILSLKITEDKKLTDKKAFSSLEIQDASKEYVENETNYKKYYSSKTNLYLEKNTVHIFIDENGNLIETGIPTTAKENYIYQLHLLVESNNIGKASYKFTYDGKYQPKFNIEKKSEELTKLNASENLEEPEIVEIPFAKIGPFTDEFTLKLEKIPNNKDKEVLLNNKVHVAKLYHVSVSTGLLATTLKNPQNIEFMQMSDRDTTLVADDPETRGILTIMATYYPKGRSFLFPPSGGIFNLSRFGVQVGARLDNKIAENFFFGFSHDFARGGAISYGAHFGRRNYVAGHKNFNFGVDKFDLPELNVKKEWQVGIYFGIVIDTRVAIELFKSLGASN
jgi:hypothetical protein